MPGLRWRAGESVGPLHRGEAPPCPGELEGEALELFEMECRERLEPIGASLGELEPDDPMILGVPGSGHEPGGVGPVDETDRAVVP